MPDRVAGYLIHFDEERRNHLLNGIRDPGDGFSDALSSADWSVRQWEVCGLMFEPDTITHWALARKGHRVATGKVKVDFTEVTPTGISIADVVQRVGETVQRNIISSRSGSGGPVPGATWQGVCCIVHLICQIGWNLSLILRPAPPISSDVDASLASSHRGFRRDIHHGP